MRLTDTGPSHSASQICPLLYFSISTCYSFHGKPQRSHCWLRRGLTHPIQQSPGTGVIHFPKYSTFCVLVCSASLMKSTHRRLAEPQPCGLTVTLTSFLPQSLCLDQVPEPRFLQQTTPIKTNGGCLHGLLPQGIQSSLQIMSLDTHSARLKKKVSKRKWSFLSSQMYLTCRQKLHIPHDWGMPG